jgi:hypothetical protein
MRIEDVSVLDLPPDEGADMEPEGGDEDFQGLVTRSVEEAVTHFQENIEPEMAKATDYYFGRPFGDEVAGRSQVVSTDVRDATLDQIPDLLEIFMASESVVEFKPRTEEEVEQAAQATDMVNYVFFEENPGFLILNSVIKDAGVRRLGYIKWSYSPQERVRGQSMTGLSQPELMYLEQQGIDYVITGEDVQIVEVPGPQGPQQQEMPVYSVDIRYKDTDDCYRVEAVPPEEIVWTPEARDFERAPTIAHVRDVPKDYLIALGIDEEFIEEHRGKGDKSRSTESLPWSRQFYGSSSQAETARSDQESESVDESQEKIRFAEVYVLADTDDDGIGELRMVQCVGPSYTIVPDEFGNVYGELVDEVPIAVFTPDPEPHTIPGLCNYDYLREVQRVKSQIQRGMLNSLALSIEQQLVVSQNQVNIRDLVAPEISGLIRVRSDVNAVREIKHSFVGPDTLPVLEYYDQIRADRIGRAGPREGLDANILQSTGQEAVSNTLTKQQQRIRMVARVYAETGFKQVFKGLYRLIVKHQKRPKMIRLRGKYAPVDPRNWSADMDVRVNVALGTGSKGQRLGELQALYADQKEQLMAGSPLVSYVELRATADKILDLMGYKDTTTFYKPWGPQEQQQMDQAQAEAAKDPKNAPPEKRVADAAELEVQMKAAAERMKDEREREKIQLENARELLKIEHDYEIAKLKVEVERIKAMKPTPTAK